jgi:hypothetical protein
LVPATNNEALALIDQSASMASDIAKQANNIELKGSDIVVSDHLPSAVSSPHAFQLPRLFASTIRHQINMRMARSVSAFLTNDTRPEGELYRHRLVSSM